MDRHTNTQTETKSKYFDGHGHLSQSEECKSLRSLQFLVGVLTFLSLILCYSYFGTFLSTWSKTYVIVPLLVKISNLLLFVFQPVTRESETQAEDEQSFLARQLQLLQQGTPNSRQESPLRTPAGVQKTGDRRTSGSPGVQGPLGSPKKVKYSDTE